MTDRDDLAAIIEPHVTRLGAITGSMRAAEHILAAGYERLVNTEQVLFDAYAALAKVGLTEQQVLDAINELLNARLLIRGRPEEA